MISCPECGNMARGVGYREVRQCACGLAYGPDAGDVWRYLRQQADCGHTLPRFCAEPACEVCRRLVAGEAG
jgi:hypothetical protein